jgi:uncharacterized protein YoxC
LTTVATVALVVAALGTVLLLVGVIAAVVQRVSRALTEASRVTERLTAASAELSDQQHVTQHELDRLSAAVEQLRSSRRR